MYYYDYKSFIKDVKVLIDDVGTFQPDVILAVARGGVTLGHFMAEGLALRSLYTLNSVHYEGEEKLESIYVSNIPDLGEGKRILVVDDIIDSGESMVEILRVLKEKYPKNSYKTAVLFHKKEALLQPDFTCHEAKEWIEFFWNI